MKKSVIISLMLFVGLLHAVATDEFAVSNVTIQQGGTTTLDVELRNGDTQCVGFQFVLVLPEGISVANKTESLLDFTEGARMNDLGFTTRVRLSDGVYNVLSYNDNVIPMTGTSGTVISIVLQANNEVAVGSQLNAFLRTCKITNADEESMLLNEELPFTITIDEPYDGRIHFDEAATTLPTYTAGEKGDVTLKRTIKTGQWSTLVLPFNLTKANATAIFGSDAEFAKFSGFVVDYGDDEENLTPLGITINFTSYTIPARGNMAGGTLVLVKPSTPKDISTIELDNVTLTNVITDTNVNDEYGTSGKFTGTLTKTKVPADGLFIADNQFWYSTGATNIKAFRGWFELGAVLNQETDFGVKLNFILDNNPTAIRSIDGEFENGKIYDLGGRRISQPRQKGVFIVNGKKVAVQ